MRQWWVFSAHYIEVCAAYLLDLMTSWCYETLLMVIYRSNTSQAGNVNLLQVRQQLGAASCRVSY